MKLHNIKENWDLYFKLIRKKIRDMKLRWKIRIFLFSITIFSCLLIGFLIYRISSNAIIVNSETMAINLIKQIGLNLDERIDAFEDVSYRILQTSSVNDIINADYEEAAKSQKDYNSALNTIILQQSSLYSYTSYALLRPKNGVIIEYYKAREKKLDNTKEEEVLNYLEQFVSITKPTNWILYEGKIYFIRKIMNVDGADNGILCFAMTDQFFSFVGTDQDYLTNDNIIILSADNTVLKENMSQLNEKQIYGIANYDESNYYVYNCTTHLKGERYVAVALNTKSNDWTVLGFMPYSKLLKNLNYILTVIILVILLVSCCIIIITTIISATITRNVAIIEQGMKNYEAGKFDIRIKPVSYDEIGLLALQLNYMGLQISNLIEMLEKEEAAKRESEYQTLQAQINPHFLYNILGSLKWSAYQKKEFETVDSIDSLINLLRFTIKRAGQILPLKEEIDYIKNYIAIEKVRYGDAFQIKYEMDEEVLEWNVPGFILQPFVENSLIHGLDMASDDAQIFIRAYKKDNKLQLEIEDNGIGMSEERLHQVWYSKEAAETKKYNGFNSIGIKIVDARLHGYYGERYETQIQSIEGKGTKVILAIPGMEG